MKNAILLSTIVLISFIGRTQCQASYTASITNGTVNFTNTSTGNFLSYYWNFGDGFSSTIQNPTHTYTTVGGYTTCLTIYSSDSLCQEVFCDSILITSVDTMGGGCVTSFTVSSNSQSITCTNTSSPGPNFFYSYWNIYDAMNTSVYASGTTDIIFFPTASGMYNVCLDAYDSLQNSCGTVCELVYFNSDSLDSNLGYFLDVLDFNIYPNPVREELTVEIDGGGQYILRLTDLSGREMSSLEMVSEKAKMDLSNFAPGLYVLNVSDFSNKTVYTRRILKD